MSEFVTPAALRAELASEHPPFVIDVRSPEDYAAGHIPGAINIPGDQLSSRLAEVPRDRPVVVY
jgi:rhodanese-related sulfurtransferase